MQVLLRLSCCFSSISSLQWDCWQSHGSVGAQHTTTSKPVETKLIWCIVPAEYAPLAIRTRAAALATASNWIFTFLVVEITPVSIGNIGWRTYVYFCVFNFCFLPLIYFCYPETRNLSLEHIDRLFTGEKIRLHWRPSMGDLQSAGTDISNGEHEAKTVEVMKE